MPPLTGLLQEGGPAALVARILEDLPYTILESHTIFFRCGCSREKVERALLSLGPDELRDIREKMEGAEVSCEFCRQTYRLDTADIERLSRQLVEG